MSSLYYETIETPAGKMTILSSRSKILRIDFGSLDQVREKAKLWFQKYFEDASFEDGSDLTQEASQQLQAYFKKERKTFSLPIELHGTVFQKQVWQSIERRLAYGEIWTYKQVGQEIENVKAVRAIGGALNKNPISIVIPCHRVIGSSGKLVGYGGGLDKKEFLLGLES